MKSNHAISASRKINRRQAIQNSLAAVAIAAGGVSAQSVEAGQIVPTKSGYAPVNDLKIYYEIYETPGSSNPPLVLLHGGGSTIQTSFGKLLPSLVKTHRVVAFEQQAHGHTADVDRPFTFEQSADDTAGLLKFLKIDKADLFGYSNGGSIALQVAMRHPQMARKLIIASAMYKRDGFDPQFWESMKHASLESMPKELKDAYLAVAPNPNHLQSFHDKCVQRMLNFKDWRAEDLRAIQSPALIMVGDADVIRPEHAVEMYRIIPHARSAVLPGNHMTLLQNADMQTPIIEEFLNGA